MGHSITIGEIYLREPDAMELADAESQGFNALYQLRVKEYSVVDRKVDNDRFETSSCYINIWGFPTFWFKIIGNSLSKKLGLHDNTSIITPESLEKFGLSEMFTMPFISTDLFVAPIKQLITDIRNLPDNIEYLSDEYSLSSDDVKFFNSVMEWFKYWSVSAVELYDEDAYIEFC